MFVWKCTYECVCICVFLCTCICVVRKFSGHRIWSYILCYWLGSRKTLCPVLQPVGIWIGDTGADEEWGKMNLFLCFCQRYRGLFLGSQMLNVGRGLEVEMKRKRNCYLRDKNALRMVLLSCLLQKGILRLAKSAFLCTSILLKLSFP